jgi:DNA repair protein RadD
VLLAAAGEGDRGASQARQAVTLTLRPYQERDVPRIRAAYTAGARAVLYVSPTGSGKTVLSAFVITAAIARGKPVLFLAGRVELLDQTKRTLGRSGVTDVRLIQAERDLGGTSAPVTIASIDTITADGWLERMPEAGLVVLDEAHHAPCDKASRIIRRYPKARLLGLTATPIRADRRPLSPPFDAMIVGPSTRELMDLGHLVECWMIAPRKQLGPNQVAADPVAAYVQHGNGEPAVVFCSGIDHAKATAAAFVAAGIPAASIDGRMSPRRRRELLDLLAAGGIRVLCSVDVVTEGFDFPPLAVAIMARKFGHVGRWIQAIGRVLRPSPETGKTIARVVDLVGSSRAPGFGPPDLPREYSLDGEGIAPMVRASFRECDDCGAMYVTAARCPHCGAATPIEQSQMPRVTGDELVGFGPPPAPRPKVPFVKRIVSKRYSTCEACHTAIRPRQAIWWVTGTTRARHVQCPTTAPAVSA